MTDERKRPGPEPVRGPEDRPTRQEAGDGLKSVREGQRAAGEGGKAGQEQRKPISARAAMGAAAPETEAPAEALPAPTHRFRHGDGEWLARIAGEGAYGSGRTGRAYVVAVHFCPADNDEDPVREVLIPAARFDGLDETELQDLFERASPIERNGD